ncbi:hypothetical protein BMF89_08305 [Arthrobacter sp. SRS-W-1-2016]|nr:hypothetical protein BMF89_08305 [Arthrobacter sp. SRS-W-1-2016]
MEFLQPGNVLVVWKLDRVGRSTADLDRIVTELDQRGIQLKSLTGSFLDTTTADGRARTRQDVRTHPAGLDAAGARGRAGGRPSKMTEAKINAARTMHADKAPIVEIAPGSRRRANERKLRPAETPGRTISLN